MYNGLIGGIGPAATEYCYRGLIERHTRDMHLVPAGPLAELDRYIGYWEPYATSHDALDADTAMQEEVRNAARTLLEAVQASRAGQQIVAGSGLKPVRQK